MKDAILKVERIFKSFHGNSVINDVSFEIPEGELSAIIGPNGAGKTTLFNLITGYHVPDRGVISFEGRSIAGLQPYQIVRRGIARAFQITNIFPRLTVVENVAATIISRRRSGLNLFRSVAKMAEVREESLKILESVGLADVAQRQCGTLAHGNQKRLDIAVALALEPRLLLLDEPTAGMSPDERRETVALVQELWETLGVTMLFIEHDMDIVFGISQKIRVLCYGSLLAEGAPAEISKNQKVIEAYLGEEL